MVSSSSKQLKRKEEILHYASELDLGLGELPKMQDELMTYQRQRQDDIENIKEDIRSFAGKIIDIVEYQADSAIKMIEQDFEQNSKLTRDLIKNLQKYNTQLVETKKFIESSKEILLENSEAEHNKIKSECIAMLEDFEDSMRRAQKLLKEPVKIIPIEKTSAFKKGVKAALNEILMSYSPASLLNSPPLPDLQNINEFADFLKSEENKEVLKMKPVKERQSTLDMIVSFDNREIFENALEASTNSNTVRSTRENCQGIVPINLFKSDSDNFSSILSNESLRTPRLNEEDKEVNYNAVFNGSTEDLEKYVEYLNQLNEAQNRRSEYLKSGREMINLDECEEYLTYLDNRLKGEATIEISSQNRSPTFKEV